VLRSWVRAGFSVLVGALYLTAIYALFVQEPLVPAKEVLLGKEAREISNYVSVRFAADIARIGRDLGLTAFGVGGALGLVAHALLSVRDWLRDRRRRRHRALHLAFVLVLVITLHASVLFASMSRWPQLYTEVFWSRGGSLAEIERTVVDRLGTHRLLFGYSVALVLYLFGLPRTWMRLGARIRAASPAAFATVVASCLAGVGLPLAFDALRPRPAIAPSSPARGADAHASTKKRPSLLIIASDGLRADRLRSDIAPHLTREADRGVRFDRAYVAIPRTFESWTTILTGRYPHHHGIRTSFPRYEDVKDTLPTVAASLRAGGWVTAAVSDYAGDIFGEADFGFSYLDVPPLSFIRVLERTGIERSAPLLPFLQTVPGRAAFPAIRLWAAAADPELVADDAISFLRRLDHRPFCLVVFFSTTHFPYAAPAPYHARYASPDYAGAFRYDKNVRATVTETPDEVDTRQIRALYDGAITAVDDAAGRLLAELERLALADDTIVVVSADHGETLFERGRGQGHGDHLLGDESVHVPLAIYDPRLASKGRTEHSIVSSVDIAPTLLELLDVTPLQGVDGRSLAGSLRGEPLEPRPAFVESALHLVDHPGAPPGSHYPAPSFRKMLEVDTEHGDRLVVQKDVLGPSLMHRHRMVRDGRYKLVYMPTPKGVVYRLYDVERDPEELTDIYDAEPEAAKRLRDLLWRWMLEDPLVERDGDLLVTRGGAR
jgi:arylsulfatase A-like enzyme